MVGRVIGKSHGDLRVLVEPNAHHLANVGDAAMLQTALERLEAAFPTARIEVITDSPTRLGVLAPEAIPIPARGRDVWFSPLCARCSQLLHPRAHRLVRHAEDHARRRHPIAWHRLLWARERLRGGGAVRALDAYVEAMVHADLLVISGAGAMVDDFAPLALTVLDQIEFVRGRAGRVAMMGQGLGPIGGLRLRRRCAQVLPQLDIMGLREGLTGPALLGSLGVAGPTVEVTGDDAIALAARGRVPELGTALGVNVRRARYSRVGDDAQRVVRDALAEFTHRKRVPLQPLPVSFVSKEDDLGSIVAVLPGGHARGTSERWAPPSALAERIARCRVVLTGSYHAAVFALAQGVPVVGLSASPYYDQKFSGLIDLYGAACKKVDLGDATDVGPLPLVAALEGTWESASELRRLALEVSDDLAERSRRLYERLTLMVELWSTGG